MGNVIRENKPVRKDVKGRILRKGEDVLKDGRYRFRYTDSSGKRYAVYSWRLTAADNLPMNAKNCMPLRELEQQIMRHTNTADAVSDSTALTLNQAFEQSIQNKKTLKPSTKKNYTYLYNRFIKDILGNKKLQEIQYTDLLYTYQELIDNYKLSFGTVKLLHAVIHSAFKSAVRNHNIPYNPADQILEELKKGNDIALRKKKALTVQEQTALLDYLDTCTCFRQWIPLFRFLLMTGCRIGEALALTWSDYDPDKGIIFIRRTLSYRKSDNGHYSIETTSPKTAMSQRIIPVYQELRQLLSDCNNGQDSNDYIFSNVAGTPILPSSVNRAIRRIVCRYNSSDYRIEHQLPELPHISAHTFRHTFCRRLCEADVNMKVIQMVMGHSDIRVTMNIYAEVSEQKMLDSIIAIQDKLSL